jgi:predicted metal-dependent HD superfamily phosphohydrolase
MENNIKLLSEQIPFYVSSIYYKYIKPELFYHNLEHTRRVVERTLEIADYYRLGPIERFILLAASWFHDTGHLFSGPQGHEEQSVAIMEPFLLEHGTDPVIIEDIRGCIMATKIPHYPTTFLQEIICDADTYNLGTEEFLVTDELLREELRLLGAAESKEWEKHTLDFLKRHRFFTSYCKEKLQKGKQDNINILTWRIESTK